MPTEIRHFFERYRDAFNLLDGEAVARPYAVPSGIAQDCHYTHGSEFEPIRDNHAIADLSWQIQWSTGAAPWQFSTTYNLVRGEEGWRVLLCTAYSESQLYSESAA